MKHTTSLLSPAMALRRVLLLELSNAGKIATTTTTSSTSSSTIRAPQLAPRQHSRTSPAATTISPCSLRSFSSTPVSRAGSKPKPFRNEKIPYQWVRLREDGQLSEPKPIETVLSSLPEGHVLEMLAHPPKPRDADPNKPSPMLGQPSAAICHIKKDWGAALGVKPSAAAVNPDGTPAPALRVRNQRKARREAEAAEAAAAASEAAGHLVAPIQTKALELNWAIAPNDLSHKMKRLADFLDKGMRVEVLLARKRGSRAATREEVDALIERVEQTGQSVPGTKEYKGHSGVPGGRYMMYLEGPPDKRKVKKEKKEPNIPADFRPRRIS